MKYNEQQVLLTSLPKDNEKTIETIESATSPRATSGTWLDSNVSRKHLLKHAERPEVFHVVF